MKEKNGGYVEGMRVLRLRLLLKKLPWWKVRFLVWGMRVSE